MDQLFLMQRYWGSDEEDIKEEDSFKVSSSSTLKNKSNIDLIDVENDDFMVSKKKRKLNSYSEMKNKSGRHKINCSLDCAIEDISDTAKYSDLLENNNNKSCLNGTGDASFELKVVKKCMPKVAKLQGKNKEIVLVENNVSNVTVNSDYSSEDAGNNKCNQSEISNAESNINSMKKERKQIFRYFNAERHDESNISASTEDSQLNNSKIKSKITKKSKLKPKEIDESHVCSVFEENMNSGNTGDNENVSELFPTIGKSYQQNNEVVKYTLPQWLSNPTYISVNLQEKEIPISELNYLDRNTKKNLIKDGISFLFPVQLAVIPWLMQSKKLSLLIRPSDICVSAPTGSGKTLAFVLPIVQSLKDRVVCAVRALVVLPVSELANQVYKVFQKYTQGTDLKVALLTGKKSFKDEQNSLVKTTKHSVQSLVDIVVATPGRIHDHIYQTQGFCLKRLRYLVIDEADRMMEEIQQGWLKQIEDAVFQRDCITSKSVCSSCKRTFYEPISAYNFGFISQPLQKLLYSATLTHDPEQLHTLSLYKPKLFTASSVDNKFKGSCAIPPGIKMLQVICEEGVKPMVICHLIKNYNFKRVLCFTETVERAHRLHLVLEEMKLLKVREISSFNKPIQRKIVLNQFCSGKINILVCSDLVARGIDIQNIDCVISYDIPENDKIYTHRIGRTARAGKTGTAVTLLSEGEVPHFKKMLSANPEIKLPEKICINPEDLKPLIDSFQTALAIADTKLKKEKSQVPAKLSKEIKKKLQ